MIKRLVRRIIDQVPASWRYHQGPERNILLFAGRRGGSSILSQILSANPRIRDVDQPFDINQKYDEVSRIRIASLPAKPFSQFSSITEEDKAIIIPYLGRLFSGQIPKLGKYVYANRTVLKIVNASAIIDFLGTHFSTDIVYLLRHPISQSLSVMRNQWEITAEAYLNDEAFASRYLTSKQLAEGRKIMESGTYLEQAVLNWCLENVVPLYYSEVEKFTITYEELVVNPKPVLKDLNDKFSINQVEKLYQVIEKPSRSSAYSDKATLKFIKAGQKKDLISKWTKKITELEKERAQEILNTFDIICYSAYQVLPNEEFLHYPLPVLEAMQQVERSEK